jgi:uncharacterized protein (TIGR04255 family)
MATQTPLRLPNAPLVEAVFELRWAVQPGLAYADPGFPILRDVFTRRAEKSGFAIQRDMAPADAIIPPHAIAKRYYVAQDREFPLLQIGPGIFATNQSAEYDWPNFKKQVINGVRLLMASYPRITDRPLTPTYLELRYLDAFDASLVDTTDLVQFLKNGTTLKIELPSYFSKIGTADPKGRISFHKDVKGWKATQFVFDIASAHSTSEDIIRLETKVITQEEGVPKIRQIPRDLTRWLEFAHGLTSPFFKEFVTAKVMDKFKKAT